MQASLHHDERAVKFGARRSLFAAYLRAAARF
jgi:hypothetical protein